MISIIIPLYNKAAYIRETIESVRSQSYDNIEVIVVDDGSTDNSAEIVRSIDDNRIRLIPQANSGVSAARNRGLKEARGEWVMFLDADDRLLPDALLELLKPTYSDDSINLVLGNYYDVNGTNRSLRPEYRNSRYIQDMYKECFLFNIAIRMGNYIVSRELQLRVLFDESLNRFEDMKMLMQLFQISKVYAIATPVMEYIGDSREQSKIISYYDYTFDLNFQEYGFWGKCMLGTLIFLSKYTYPKDQGTFRHKYGIYYYYGTLSLIIRRVNRIIRGGVGIKIKY